MLVLHLLCGLSANPAVPCKSCDWLFDDMTTIIIKNWFDWANKCTFLRHFYVFITPSEIIHDFFVDFCMLEVPPAQDYLDDREMKPFK